VTIHARVLALGGLVALMLSLVGVASADPPSRSFLPAPPASGRFCADFDVLVEAVQNNEYATTFSGGATIITGRLVEQLTNLANNKTIELDASGPVFVSEEGTTVTLRGNTLLFGEAGDFGPGSPATLQLVSGVVTVSLSSEGITGVSKTGKVRDVCAELA
jgi:hypothetical protein